MKCVPGAMTDQRQDIQGVVVFPPLLWGGARLIGLLLHWIWPVHPLHSTVARVAGVVLFVLSLAVALWAERAMHRAGTEIRPDRPSTAIVTDGPYRFSRNPIYLASAGLVAAIS